MFSINFYHRAKSKKDQKQPSGSSKKRRIAKYALLSVLTVVALFLIIFASYSVTFAHKFYANQYLGGVKISGMTTSQAKNIMEPKLATFLDQSISLNYQKEGAEDKPYEIKPRDISLQYDLDKSINDAWRYGHKNGAFQDLWQQFKSIFIKNRIALNYTLDGEVLNQKIEAIATEIDNPEKDYSIVYTSGQFVLTTERQEGNRIDQEEIIENVKNQISNIKNDQISFLSKVYKPQILEVNARKKLEQAKAILSLGDLTLTYGDQTFPADKDTLGSFISTKSNGEDLEIIYNEDRIKLFVETIAKSIDLESQNAQLKVVSGQVSVFQVARMGAKLDQVQTKIDIKNALYARMNGTTDATATSIKLNVASLKPDITNDAVNNLGLKELVGTGTTNFVKSPANRVHNIQIGAAAINGALVKPGETFSTLGKLGKIDASTGYLPELVIKNNQTVPDYGGGLCQVSTTLFRAALNSGLKITERQNHSYRVSYYEPPIGMDATIYDPSPDFKFINNYDNYIFIQYHIDGTKLTFDIYGTKDGRVATSSTPQAYNYVEPPARVDTETDTLPAGQTQQIQKAHQGASAKFQYKVVKGDQVLQDTIFTSVYVALPEKWLVGKAAPTVPTEPPPTPPTPPIPPAPTCSDGIQNGDETGVDCGGSCPTVCPTP